MSCGRGKKGRIDESHVSRPLNLRRRRFSPSAMRVPTVETGTPVRSAISRRERSSKKRMSSVER
jgi:hypothetical protein